MAKIKSPCAIEGCQKPSRTRGWCSAHYERVRVHGDPGTRTIGDRKNHCSMPDCDQTANGHGYCSKHYNRFVRHGSPLVTLRVAGDPIDRFWHYVQKGADPSSCWLWTGGLNQDGYGVSTMNKKSYGAHRFAWKLLRGDVPEGLVLDHLCRVRHCVNPDHLEVVTILENVRRGDSVSDDVCRNGHPRTPENTGYGKNGRGADGVARYCKICFRKNQKKYKDRKRAEARGVEQPHMIASSEAS